MKLGHFYVALVVLLTFAMSSAMGQAEKVKDKLKEKGAEVVEPAKKAKEGKEPEKRVEPVEPVKEKVKEKKRIEPVEPVKPVVPPPVICPEPVYQPVVVYYYSSYRGRGRCCCHQVVCVRVVYCQAPVVACGWQPTYYYGCGMIRY
jgi:hypothetical protein